MEFFSELLQVSAVQWLRTGMAIALVLLIVFAGEAIYRFLPHGERFSRKFVHIGAGIAVAFLPYFGLNQVLTVSIGVFFTVANFVAIQLGLFQGIHNKKDTYGTVFFPIAFTFLCYYSWSEVWLITIPLIIMAVGDGIASLVGENVANKRILHPDIPGKTWQGSGAMFGIALATFAFYYLFVSATPIDLYLLLALPAGALLVTLSETVAWKGSDNISVPFFAWLVMRLIGTGMADMITFTLVLMLLFAWLTWRLRVLSTDGAIAVVLLGFFLLTIGGLGWIVPIVTFFVLSSALSKLPRRGREIKAGRKGRPARRQSGSGQWGTALSSPTGAVAHRTSPLLRSTHYCFSGRDGRYLGDRNRQPLWGAAATASAFVAAGTGRNIRSGFTLRPARQRCRGDGDRTCRYVLVCFAVVFCDSCRTCHCQN
jgi:phytol kinase